MIQMKKTELNIYEKLAVVNHKLNCTELKKSGFNKFGNFAYYELEDLLPTIEQSCFENGLLMQFQFDNSKATIKFINTSNPKETYSNSIPLQSRELPNLPKMNEFQVYGSMMTYYKRYLLLNTFNISENSIIDNANYEEMQKKDKSKKPAKKEQAQQEQKEKTGLDKEIEKYCEMVIKKGKKINKKTLTDVICEDYKERKFPRELKQELLKYVKFLKMQEIKSLKQRFENNVKKD